MLIRIPFAPHDISPEWLTDALRSTGQIGAEAVTYVTADVIGADRGFTGVVARLRLMYSNSSGVLLPSTVVVKMPHAEREEPSAFQVRQAASEEARRSLLQRGIRELAFYDEIVPESHVAVPTKLFGAADHATLRSILVLEDLSGAVAGDVLEGCPASDAEHVLCAMAALHARWWQDVTLETRDWMAQAPVDSDLRRRRYAGALPEFLARHWQRLPDSFREILTALEREIPDVIRRAESAPRTLIHGDLHLDNIMFTPERDDGPVRILDWQSVASGQAAQDVALFLSGALSPGDQAAATENLLDRYFAELVRGGVIDYGREEFQRDYQLSLLLVIVGVVIWLGSADMNALAGRERAIVEAAIADGRLIAAAESQNLRAAIPTN